MSDGAELTGTGDRTLFAFTFEASATRNLWTQIFLRYVWWERACPRAHWFRPELVPISTWSEEACAGPTIVNRERGYRMGLALSPRRGDTGAFTEQRGGGTP